MQGKTVDAAVTGEVKYHEWLQTPAGKTLVDGGHFFTESAVTQTLATWISQRFPALSVVLGEQTAPYETVKD